MFGFSRYLLPISFVQVVVVVFGDGVVVVVAFAFFFVVVLYDAFAHQKKNVC